MKIGLNGPQDLLALLVRRKWWVLGPFLALSSAIAVLTYFLPKTYVSETLILVRPRDVPQDFVVDLIATSPEQRLRAIEQTILSRTNLLQILREFGDKLPELNRFNMDERVAKLRDQIHIFFQLEKGGNGQALPLTYFRVSYQNQNPEVAQKIATKLTGLFIEQDNKTRETQVFGTTEFFSAELEKVSQQLTESEDKLKVIKSSRQFELPDQRDANLRTLDRLGNDKKANAEALDRYASLRLSLESQLSQTPQFLPRTAPTAAPASNPRVEEYRKAQAEFDEVSLKYTARHPEVQLARTRLQRLKEKLTPEMLAQLDGSASEPDDTKSAAEPNPVYTKIVAQLQELKTEFSIRERDKKWIETEILKYNGRVENTPNAEQDIAEAVRHNQDLKKQYDDLKEKLSQARLAESLESKQKGSQFSIVDPANYPLEPSKPNKAAVLLGGTLFSLLVSVAFAAAVDIARQKVWTQSQIEAYWGVPVLVDIPEILTDEDLTVGRKKLARYTAYSLAAVAAYSVCLYGVYLKHNFILQQLDPVIQELVYR